MYRIGYRCHLGVGSNAYIFPYNQCDQDDSEPYIITHNIAFNIITICHQLPDTKLLYVISPYLAFYSDLGNIKLNSTALST